MRISFQADVDNTVTTSMHSVSDCSIDLDVVVVDFSSLSSFNVMFQVPFLPLAGSIFDTWDDRVYMGGSWEHNWPGTRRFRIWHNGKHRCVEFQCIPSIDNILKFLEGRCSREMQWCDWYLLWGYTDLLSLHCFHRCDLSWDEFVNQDGDQCIDLTLYWRGTKLRENWKGVCYDCGNVKWLTVWNCLSARRQDREDQGYIRLSSVCSSCHLKKWGLDGEVRPVIWSHHREALLCQRTGSRDCVIYHEDPDDLPSPFAVPHNPFLYLWSSANTGLEFEPPLRARVQFKDPPGFDPNDPYWAWQPWMSMVR